MAKQEECSKCKRAKQGGYAGEIKCSFYGRKPVFDDSPCSSFLNVNGDVKCPECGQEVSPSVNICPNCGCPMKEESFIQPEIYNSIDNSNICKENKRTDGTHKKKKSLLWLILVGLAIIATIIAVVLLSPSSYEKQTNTFLKEYENAILQHEEYNAAALRDSLASRELTEEQSSIFFTLSGKHEAFVAQLEQERYEERQRQIRNSFVGTYYVPCEKSNYSTTHVYKSYWSDAQDIRRYEGVIRWKEKITVRDDLTVSSQRVDGATYDANGQLKESHNDSPVKEIGRLEVISENLFRIVTSKDYDFIDDADGIHYSLHNGEKKSWSVRFYTNRAVFDTKTSTIYQSLEDYNRRNEPYGYDRVYYEYAKFVFQRGNGYHNTDATTEQVAP